MNLQKMLDDQVQRWHTDGLWIDRGRWQKSNGALAYIPTRREIAAKCKLLRTLPGWRGANKRAPRGGEFGVATTAGI